MPCPCRCARLLPATRRWQPPMAHADTIALIGPMGAGKSSIGRRLAKQLGVPFTDTDAVLARTNGPIPELFAHHGADGFRRLATHPVRPSPSPRGLRSEERRARHESVRT